MGITVSVENGLQRWAGYWTIILPTLHFRIWMCPSILASHLVGLFHHKPALVASFILWLEYLLCAHHTHFPIFQLPGTHVDPLFCQPGPFMACAPPRTPFCAPLHTPAHLRSPLHTFVLHLSWACHPYLTFL